MTLFRDEFSVDEWTSHDFTDVQDTPAVFGADVSSVPGPVESNTTPTAILIDTRDSPSNQRGHVRRERLPLLQLADWDPERRYDEDPPQCIHYSIEWKVVVNKKRFLQPNLEKVLRKKVSRNKDVRCDDTKVVISVTERSERDIIKQFDDTKIDWSIMEKQLLAWGEFFRAGKKLRVDLAFNCLESHPPSINSSSKRGDKRSSSSTTQRILGELDAQLDAEEDSLGHPSTWRHVYSVMRCPGRPCDLGLYCWRDPVGKKHYPLKSHHLKSLISHVQQGSPLQTHDDVPKAIREQLVAEEQRQLDRKQTAAAASSHAMPPITINNVLPNHSGRASLPALEDERNPPLQLLNPITPNHLDVPGLRDDAVR